MPLPKTQSNNLRRVHKRSPDRYFATVSVAFGRHSATLPHVLHFNPEVFKAIRLHWMTACGIPFNAVEDTSFRLLAVYLATCAYSSKHRR